MEKIESTSEGWPSKFTLFPRLCAFEAFIDRLRGRGMIEVGISLPAETGAEALLYRSVSEIPDDVHFTGTQASLFDADLSGMAPDWPDEEAWGYKPMYYDGHEL